MNLINVTLQWSETSLYGAGERRLKKVPWNYPTLPDVTDTIDVMDFLKKCKDNNTFSCRPHEYFMYKNIRRCVFEWIQQEHFWTVEHRKWKMEDVGIIPAYIITDIGYTG
ncbi:hypothetical protein HN014_10580 [Aquimarina sp. TRL1]|uniref:hypothetical protein n=1 Tax=Aquimarina sp. (strain TRL1) TaxID=2736252 RepID=UPI00158AD194|nr:hypothetical protein [Aquimarina sp. TRL1]QKX05342.1 hypothetical protein HN014_10580 [Aquimarina sp. TRL1]